MIGVQVYHLVKQVLHFSHEDFMKSFKFDLGPILGDTGLWQLKQVAKLAKEADDKDLKKRVTIATELVEKYLESGFDVIGNEKKFHFINKFGPKKMPEAVIARDSIEHLYSWSHFAPLPWFQHLKRQAAEIKRIKQENAAPTSQINASTIPAKDYEPVDLTIDKGVVKKMLLEGEGNCPRKGQEVTFHYECALQQDGKIFDRSADYGEPLKIKLGAKQVIRGMEIGLLSMKLGEKAQLTVTSEYAYGDAGHPPNIPAKATLQFTLWLIQIAERRIDKTQMSDDALGLNALKEKELGNANFKKQSFAAAIEHYKEALANIDHLRVESHEMVSLKLNCYQNMALCLNKSGKFHDAVVQCTLAIDLDETSAKALYIRAVAQKNLKNYGKA